MLLTPVPPVLSDITSTSITVTPGDDGNPTGTYYAYKVVKGASTKYVNAAGTLQATVVYMNVSDIVIIGLGYSTIYDISLSAAEDANGTNATDFGVASTATTLGLPDTVKALHVTNLLAERGYLIEWQQNLERNIVSYRVYRSPSPTDTSAFQLVSVRPATDTLNYVDHVPYTFGVVWYYKVSAVDDGGNESNLSLTTPISDASFHSFEEQPFASTVQASDFVQGEVAQGVTDGINMVFSTLYLFAPNTLLVFLNGVVVNRGIDYNEGPLPGQFTFTDAPDSGGLITVNYIKLA